MISWPFGSPLAAMRRSRSDAGQLRNDLSKRLTKHGAFTARSEGHAPTRHSRAPFTSELQPRRAAVVAAAPTPPCRPSICVAPPALARTRCALNLDPARALPLLAGWRAGGQVSQWRYSLTNRCRAACRSARHGDRSPIRGDRRVGDGPIRPASRRLSSRHRDHGRNARSRSARRG